MRLIDAPVGIFRFDSELVLKTEYYSENKQSGKYIPDCYIVRTGEYFWGDAKTANELINLDVEPVDFAELLPTVTDTISRQRAIDALNKLSESTYEVDYGVVDCDDAINAIAALPPTEPKRGEWILHTYLPHHNYCSICEKDSPYNKRWNFCPNCGADMRGGDGMSILIRGMEMPKHGDVLVVREYNGKTYIKHEGHLGFEEILSKIPTPHGRLIDADELNIHDISPVNGFCVMGVTEEDIGLADTVIEAEGSENGFRRT